MRFASSAWSFATRASASARNSSTGPKVIEFGWARLGAGGLEPVLLPVVTERAFSARPRPRVGSRRRRKDTRERSSRSRCRRRAARTHRRLIAHDPPVGQASRQPGVRAVLADVRHHHPAAGRGLDAVHLLDESDVAPRRRRKPVGVVVGVSPRTRSRPPEADSIACRPLACLAPDATRDVGEEPCSGVLIGAFLFLRLRALSARACTMRAAP